MSETYGTPPPGDDWYDYLCMATLALPFAGAVMVALLGLLDLIV